jgi:shikimate kinase
MSGIRGGASKVLLPYSDRNLILTGYTGPNQPRIGMQVAERMKIRYVNVEMQIEARAEMPADVFRARYGEARLKTIEGEVMRDVLLHRGALIRIGGETLLRGDNAKRLQETGPIICLVVTLDAVLHRLHLTLGRSYHNPHERALAVGNLKREWAVRQLEGVHELDTTYLSEEETITSVIELWRKAVAVSG